MTFDYAGCFHIHTSYSFDGTTPIEEVVAAARRQKLDFIVVTDHFRLDARADGWEGWHDGVFVVVGEEISPRHNHYLALGIDRPLVYAGANAKPQEYIDAVNARGGFGLIAHPDHAGAPRFGVKEYGWQDWSATGYAGISIWDLMTDWQEKLTSVPAALAAYFSPAWRLSGPKQETLARWDELNRTGRVAGYGEIDNHNSRRKIGPLTTRVFPFDLAFSTIRTRVVLDDPLSSDADTARQQLFAAMKGCRMYVAQERWRTAKDFLFRVYDAERTAGIGGEIPLGSGDMVAEVRTPEPGHIRLMKDGQALGEADSDHLQQAIDEPGVYRVEVAQTTRGRRKPWIYSNPVWVRKP